MGGLNENQRDQVPGGQQKPATERWKGGLVHGCRQNKGLD